MRRLLAILNALSAIATAALGCECSYAPPCSRINETAAIFIGRVLDSGPEGHGPFRFAVEEQFKGLDTGIREVDVQAGLCVAGYETGRRYLMLAGRWNDGALYSGDCTGSVPVADAEDDIKFIRAWAQGARTMFLQGRVAENVDDNMVRYMLDVEHSKPLPGVEIVATKDGEQYRGFSNSKGFFRISVPEAGPYRVVARHAGFSSSEAEYQFSVEPGSCAENDIGMWTDSRVKGHVRDSEGHPVAGITVQMEAVSEDSNASDLAVLTDDKGAFEFTKMPPGEYILGVNINGLNSKVPYSPRFYPGVSRRENATAIRITGSETLHDFDFSVEHRKNTRTIAVAVFWPDGKPVTNASVSCKSRSDDSRFIYDSIHRYTNSKGEALCRVLTDRDFQVEADRLSWSSSSRPVRPIENRAKVSVPAGEDLAQVRIVIDKVNDISDEETPADMSQFNDEEGKNL